MSPVFSKLGVEGTRPIFQNFVVCVKTFIWRIITLQIWIENFIWKGHAVWMYESIFVCCSCLFYYCVSWIKVTITRHVFINISQNERFSVVKYAIDHEKNMSFLVIKNLLKVIEKGRIRVLSSNVHVAAYYPSEWETKQCYSIKTLLCALTFSKSPLIFGIVWKHLLSHSLPLPKKNESSDFIESILK